MIAPRTLLLLIFLGWLITAAAATPVSSPDELNFRVWQVKDGLPQNQVRAILQTREGYLWIATYDGLARFDGLRFVVFNHENTPALRSNIFTSLYEDHHGTLWIGSDGGLIRYVDGAFKVFTTTHGLTADTVTSIAESASGQLFIATSSELNVMDGEKFSRFRHPALENIRSIKQLRLVTSGELWMATNQGAYRIKGNEVRHFTTHDGLTSESISTISEDRAGNLWFATIGQGVSCYRQGRFENPVLKPGDPQNIVYTLTEDRAGQLWLGTHGGLSQYGKTDVPVLARQNGLPSDFVTALYADRENNLWVGTDGGGLVQVRNSGVKVLTKSDGLAGDFVRSIVEDPQGGVWIASWFSDSLSLWRNGQIQIIGQKNSLLRGGVRALLMDRAGTLWLATASGRLVSFRAGIFTDRLKSTEPTPPIFALAEDQQGQLWVGRSDGLWLFQNGNLKQILANPGPIPPVRTIVKSRDGGLWAGTDSGLWHYREGQLRRYTDHEGLPYPFVSGLYEDRDGVLWVGTRGGGLSRLQNGTFTTFTMKEGLPSAAVYQMLEDDHENLWCGSSRGIFHISRRELMQAAVGKQLNTISYTQSEGLQNSVHFGTHPSACRTRDGKLWFPTMNGLTMITPEKINFNDVAPPVAIEQVLVDKQEFRISTEIVAPPGQGEIEIRYTGLSFVAPEHVSFRYQLEGFQPDWVEAGVRRSAFFTNLSPGDYTFRVLAGNTDGVWNKTGAVIRFRLRPHFYQTWWFYLSCGLGVTGLGWLVHRQRVRQMQVRHQAVMAERNRIARDIHDTLAQEVAGLLAQLHVIKTLLPFSPQNAGRHLERAVELARTGLADARRLVLDLRHQALERDDLATAFENFIAQVSADESPRLTYQVKGTPRRLSGEQENNLLRIGQESVTNALRHARAELIGVSLSFEPKQVELRVWDNGCGFDTTLHTQGFGGHYGLLGIRERSAQIGGELSLSSLPGIGTEIKIRLKTGTSA